MEEHDYIVMAAYTNFELAKKVNNYLRKGWICQGGVCVMLLNPADPNQERPLSMMPMAFYQAMIREE